MSLTTKQKVLKQVGRHVPPFFPVLSDELRKYTLLELLEEAEERAAFWNHCAVGERFQPINHSWTAAEASIRGQNFTEKQAEVILECGLQFYESLQDALKNYKAILKVLPNQHATVESKPE